MGIRLYSKTAAEVMADHPGGTQEDIDFDYAGIEFDMGYDARDNQNNRMQTILDVGDWTPLVDIPEGERIIGMTAQAGDDVAYPQGFAFILGKQDADTKEWTVTDTNFSYK
jgi:hypothetical protein